MSTLFMLTERPSVYLASKSPRRQELLRQIGVEFEELLLRDDERLFSTFGALGRSRYDEARVEYRKHP